MRVASPPESPSTTLPEVELAGVRLHALDEAGCVAHVLAELDRGRGGTVVTPNLDHLRRYRIDERFADCVDESTLRVADGRPLLWAARLQGTPLPGLVAGSNLISSLSEGAAKRGRRVFFLGGDPGTADRAAGVLASRYDDFEVAGTNCPEFGFEKNPATLDALRDELTNSAADIVFVALGSPKQEYVIRALRDSLPGAWWIGVGISFSFVCGEVQRAPRWMQRTGLEWLHRLGQEPGRLAKRYLVHGLPFAARFLLGSAWKGVTRT